MSPRMLTGALALALAAVALPAPAQAVPASRLVAADSPDDAYDTEGDAVEGTSSPGDAPRLQVGQYVDDIPVGPGTRHYRISRTAGSALYVSTSSRPRRNATSNNTESWRYEIARLDGGSCVTSTQDRTDSYGMNLLVPSTLVVPADDSACGVATDLVLTVGRTEGGDQPAKAEIRVIEEPSVTNVDALPGPEAAFPPALRPPVGEAKEVTGGGGLSTAAEIGSGTFVTKIRPGQMVFFKTRLDDGQRATFAVDGPEGFTAWPDDSTSMYIRAQVYDPLRRGALTDPVGQYTKASYADDQVFATPTIRYRNRFADDSDIRGHAVAGDYYYGLVLGHDGALKGVTEPVGVKFSIKVEGTPGGRPEYVKGVVPSASASASGSFEAAAPPDTGATPESEGARLSAIGKGGPGIGVLAGLGLAGVAALALVGYLASRTLASRR